MDRHMKYYLVQYEAPADWVPPPPVPGDWNWYMFDAAPRDAIQKPLDKAEKVFKNAASAKGSATKARRFGLIATVSELDTSKGRLL